MKQFREILRELKQVCDEEGLEVDPNIPFDGGVRIYNSLQINKLPKKDEAMTAKQRKLLEKLDYKGRMDLSKGEAINLIQKLIDEK